MSSKEVHLSASTIDALALEGALDAATQEAAEAHLRSCSKCNAEASAGRALRDRFATDVFPRTVESVVRKSALQKRGRVLRLGLQVAVPTLALAAAVTLLLRSSPAPSSKPADRDYLAVKGSAAMQIVARRGGHSIDVHDGVVLAPEDQIRFMVEPAGLPYLLVVSIDGAGAASVYYPYDGRESARLSSVGKFEVPGSIVLDRAPGPERIYALLSEEPIAASDVLPALRAIGARGREGILGTRELPVRAATQLSIVFDKSVP